jgi:3-methyladenine DNA glycosylase AlkD
VKSNLPEAPLKVPDKAAAAWLEERLRPLGTPERAAGQKAYLHSELEFWGTAVSEIRSAVKDLATGQPAPSRDEVLHLAAELWSPPVHELRMSAVLLLVQRVKLLGPADLDFVERLVRESKTWAYVDALAGDVAGAVVLREPLGTRATLDRWAADADFWVRRSALLSLLRALRRGEGWAFVQFTGYADAMLDEKEFFIRKAIGWVLRETSKRRPDLVADWLAPRTQRASGVTMREAVKYVDVADRERLMLAYQQRRPAVEVAR